MFFLCSFSLYVYFKENSTSQVENAVPVVLFTRSCLIQLSTRSAYSGEPRCGFIDRCFYILLVVLYHTNIDEKINTNQVKYKNDVCIERSSVLVMALVGMTVCLCNYSILHSGPLTLLCTVDPCDLLVDGFTEEVL